MKFTDIVSPFLAWSRAARRVDTIPYPKRRTRVGQVQGFTSTTRISA